MHSEQLVRQAETAVEAAIALIEREGVHTYDPLDLTSHPVSQRLLTVQTKSGAVIRKLLWAGAYLAPRATRRLSGVKPTVMHSGVANLVAAYLELGGDENISKAKHWLDWLRENAFVLGDYLGWGFPFSWKQKLLVLPGTPIGHTTMTCANAYLKYHHATGDTSMLEVVRSACDFFHRGLYHSFRQDGSVAVSYTPLDQTHIINVQADVSSLLLRLWKLTGQERDYTLGLSLLRCVLNTQNSDGSWSYYSPDTTKAANFVDNHHTGMVLSALAEIDGVLPEGVANDVKRAVTTGTTYFLERLFESDGTPKYLDKSLYPIEIYNFAQSIITCLDLKAVLRTDNELTAKIERRLTQVVESLLRTMRTRNGGFLFRRTKWLKQDLGSLRWANALTVAALARWAREARCGQQETHERHTLQSA